MKYLFTSFILIVIFSGCNSNPATSSVKDSVFKDNIAGSIDSVPLPAPYATKSVKNFSKVLGWVPGKMPVAPQGFTVTKFSDGLNNPRSIYVAPNGDIFIAESNTELKGVKKVAADISGKSKSQRLGNSANRITLLRDKNNDGIPETKTIFLAGLNQPFGMAIINDKFYVANTDGLWQYPYKEGDTVITAQGKKIVELPAGGYNNHWTRNIVTNKDKSKIYISVGSGSNNGENGMENEIRRANILEVNIDGTGERIFASGLRNPCGIAFHPTTNTLYTVVNERDNLGDELVPDYLTSVKEGGFYGWPYSYFGTHADPSIKVPQRPDLVKKSITPELSLGAHTASLGLAFYTGNAFLTKYKNGAFIGQHGSWNRAKLSGYKVVFVPFANGKVAGKPEDFLTGFIANEAKSEVYGRPVSVAVLKDGSLLVADDSGNTIWRVAATK